MVFEFSHTHLAALTAASASLLACGPGGVDDDQFRITKLEYDDNSTLTLTFSQPIANADAIDPNDFRISLGRTFRSSYTDPETGQTEVNQLTLYEDIGWLGDYEYDYDAGVPDFAFVSASLGASPTQLELVGLPGYLAPACEFVDYYGAYYDPGYASPGWSADIGLFLHYAGQDIPLASEDGEALGDIGAFFVIDRPDYIERDSYGFVNLRPLLRIPCG